jgi:hypothetical protein
LIFKAGIGILAVSARKVGIFYATEQAAWAVANQMSRNLSEGERTTGGYLVRAHKSVRCWGVRWLAQ